MNKRNAKGNLCKNIVFFEAQLLVSYCSCMHPTASAQAKEGERYRFVRP